MYCRARASRFLAPERLGRGRWQRQSPTRCMMPRAFGCATFRCRPIASRRRSGCECPSRKSGGSSVSRGVTVPIGPQPAHAGCAGRKMPRGVVFDLAAHPPADAIGMTIAPTHASRAMSDTPTRGFSPQEFAGRTARAQRLMHQARLDALLVTAPPNFRYFSGFNSRFWESPTRPWFIVVPADGEPLAIIPDIAAPELARTWIRNIHTWPAPRPSDDGGSLLREVFNHLPNKRGRIGAELGREMALRMPIIEFMALRDAVRGFAFVDGSPCLWQIRQVKTPAESSTSVISASWRVTPMVCPAWSASA